VHAGKTNPKKATTAKRLDIERRILASHLGIEPNNMRSMLWVTYHNAVMPGLFRHLNGRPKDL